MTGQSAPYPPVQFLGSTSTPWSMPSSPKPEHSCKAHGIWDIYISSSGVRLPPFS